MASNGIFHDSVSTIRKERLAMVEQGLSYIQTPSSDACRDGAVNPLIPQFQGPSDLMYSPKLSLASLHFAHFHILYSLKLTNHGLSSLADAMTIN